MQTKLFRRDFTLVVIGQIISLFGNAIYIVWRSNCLLFCTDGYSFDGRRCTG